jgi:hypothetical protein
VSWEGSTDHIKLFVNGKRVADKAGANQHVIQRGGLLNIGRYQTSLQYGSIQFANDFIGQLGHLNMWDFIHQESTIAVYAKGPGSESGNVVPWAVARAWVSGGISVINPSSCLLKGKTSVVSQFHLCRQFIF